MMTTKEVALGLIMCISDLYVQRGYPQDVDPRGQVSDAIEQFGTAYRNADVTTLRRLLARDYIHINGGSGSQIDREEWLSWVQTQRELLNSGRLRFDSYDISEAQIRVYGQVAVATGIVRSSGIRNEEPFSVSVRFTNVWVMEDGAWRRAAFHDSPLP